VVLGTIAALASTRAIESQIAGVSAADPFIYVGTVAAMVLSAMLATWHPARRAARVDPIVTLKSE
jgi:ABC-type lipoprotein release transport system permease subunit